MKKLLLPPIYCLLLSSCATLLNSSTQKINIHTDKRLKLIAVSQSIPVTNDSNAVYVERNRSPLAIQVLLDSSTKTVLVSSSSSLAFWSNIYFNYGLGMLVEINNPKRYAYPTNIYLQVVDSNVTAKKSINSQKAIIDKRQIALLPSKYIWHLALPHINQLIVNTIDGQRSSGGFFGIETGLDYFYKPKKFASLYIGTATDFLIPFPAPLDVWGEQERSTSFFITARNNKIVNRVTLGYGLSYAGLKWTKTNNTDTTFKTQTLTTSSLGLSGSVAYRLGKSFQIGLLYQPYLLQLNKSISFNYQQQASIEFIWKAPLYKKQVSNKLPLR